MTRDPNASSRRGPADRPDGLQEPEHLGVVPSAGGLGAPAGAPEMPVAPAGPPPDAPPTRKSTRFGRKGSEEVTRTPQQRSAVKFTRLAAAWWAVIVGSLFLIVLLVFIAQNTESIAIHFLGWTWHAPLAVAFLAASVCGALITVMIGAARMIQLRKAANKNLRRR